DSGWVFGNVWNASSSFGDKKIPWVPRAVDSYDARRRFAYPRVSIAAGGRRPAASGSRDRIATLSFFLTERVPDERATVPAGAAAALRRQRLRGLDIRNRLVPAPPTGDRFLGGVPGCPPRHVHGGHVPRQLPPRAVHLANPAPAPHLRVSGDGNRRVRSAHP